MATSQEAWNDITSMERIKVLEQAGFENRTAYFMARGTWIEIGNLVQAEIQMMGNNDLGKNAVQYLLDV